ncbi:PEGA domain-containing protein [Vibrio hepatarius]|uniref:PEGA domain-containing protein n=1 Tax=Vibrio hepatarius TaxID=171383 RepID=UPI001C08FE7D|nr:PEGA domain-containing protein [Vibrio hepatarius]MBU2899357.1 PEGA domain-containing protein [Vibrio hepatarius]
MIIRRIPALLIALSPLWASTSIFAEMVDSADPVATIDSKLENKQSELQELGSEFEAESSRIQTLRAELGKYQREEQELNAKRNRAKSALDKQYNRLLDDPDVDLLSFQQEYQEAWASLKKNQTQILEQEQSITEQEMRLSQIKQKRSRINSELSYLKEQKVEARVKRLDAELRESDVLNTAFKTTCSATMTLGECTNQGKYLTKQRAVNSFKTKLLDSLTEANIAKQNMKGVQLNVFVQESQIIRSGFEGNNSYYTEMQAQLQARPEASAACKLLNVSSRYCLNSASIAKKEKSTTQQSWANITIRSDQYQDRVTINGVNYGSTPIEVVLPKGKHQFTVSKDGFQTYNRTIAINGNDTVWVKLRPNSNI